MQNGAPTWREYEELVKRLSQITQANTRSLQLLHAAILADARIADETKHLVSTLRVSSGSDAERVVSKVEVLTEVARATRDAARDALVESRATNERLGVTREEIGALRIEAREMRNTPPQGTPLPVHVAEEAPPQDGITFRQGKVQVTAGTGSLWRGAKRFVPWVASTAGGGVAWHFLRHLFGL